MYINTSSILSSTPHTALLLPPRLMDEDTEHPKGWPGTQAVKDLELEPETYSRLRTTVGAASHPFRPLTRALQLVWGLQDTPR